MRHPDIAPCHCRTSQGATRQLRTLRLSHVAPCNIALSHLATFICRTVRLKQPLSGDDLRRPCRGIRMYSPGSSHRPRGEFDAFSPHFFLLQVVFCRRPALLSDISSRSGSASQGVNYATSAGQKSTISRTIRQTNSWVSQNELLGIAQPTVGYRRTNSSFGNTQLLVLSEGTVGLAIPNCWFGKSLGWGRPIVGLTSFGSTADVAESYGY